MTKAALVRTVRVWQRRLGLDAWDVEVDFREPPTVGSDASTWRASDYDRAIVRFDAGWPSWDALFANRIVAHELLHLVTRDVDSVVEDVASQMERGAAAQVERRYDHEIEGVVDRLAYRLVEIGGLA